MVRGSKDYGQMKLTHCVASVPQTGTPCAVGLIAGCIKILPEAGPELFFPVQRIRCWKVSIVPFVESWLIYLVGVVDSRA